MFSAKSTATATVRRVRLRSTMCVPPCDVGVKPIPPKPASRPECISTSLTSAEPRQHLEDCEHGDHRARHGTGAPTVYPGVVPAGDDVRAKIQRLLVTGDNRLKQGVAPEKVRESYEQALAVAREAGLEEAVRPLVEIRLADLDARADADRG